MRKIIPIILLSFIFTTSKAQIGGNALGARSKALGGTSILQCDSWSGLNNPAILSGISEFKFGAYFENKFMISSLSNKALSVIIPLDKSALGFGFNHYGNHLYNESEYSFSFGMKLLNNLSGGVKLNYYVIRQIEELGQFRNFSFDAGFNFQLNDKIKLALFISNPIIIKTRNENQYTLPSLFDFGLNYNISTSLSSFVQISYHNSEGESLCIGFEHNINNKIFSRIGFGTRHQEFSIGAGFLIRKLQIDFSATHHPVLGIYYQTSLSISIKK